MSWKKLKGFGKNLSILRKNSSFSASKLNKPVVTNYTCYHKSVEKKPEINPKHTQILAPKVLTADILNTLEYSYFIKSVLSAWDSSIECEVGKTASTKDHFTVHLTL